VFARIGPSAPSLVSHWQSFRTTFYDFASITGDGRAISVVGLVSRVTPVHTAMLNYRRDEGRPFEIGNQVLISNHRKLLSSKATVVNVAEKPGQDSPKVQWKAAAFMR
jgi:hypothetical protein